LADEGRRFRERPALPALIARAVAEDRAKVSEGWEELVGVPDEDHRQE
jgi:hypothetical protein